MTTNHRPTLESRRGRELQPTSIVHARALPAHKQLKYRGANRAGESLAQSVDKKDAHEKLQQLKRELMDRENEHFGVVTDKKDKDVLLIENNDNADGNNETYAQKRRRIQEENKDLDESDSDGSNDNDNDSSDDDSEDEDDSDDEADLLAELQKIKREKAELQRKQQEEQRHAEIISSNPLMNHTTTTKKSWRQTSVFKQTQSSSSSALSASNKEKDNYVNDALRSDFHRKFLDRYIK